MAEKGKFSESEIFERLQQWESDGFQFAGNGFLDSDDPVYCPGCGEPGFWYVLFEHPAEAVIVETEFGEVRVPLTNTFNRCYECGWQWFDEDFPPRRSE